MRGIFVIPVVAAVLLVLVSNVATADNGGSSDPTKLLVKMVKGKTLCIKGWECREWSIHCCNLTISEYFQSYQFENLFSKRNSPVGKAVGFWDYFSFITAAAIYEPLGFGTTGGKLMQMKEISAFLGHVGSKTSSEYYGRGALPIYWNYNYGAAGEALKVDLLNHPEYIEQNATLAFQAAIWRWMTPIKKSQPSAHDIFVAKWKPTKNDTLAKRVPGFGATMNILYGDLVCGQGDIDAMNNIVSHYQYYLDLLGVGREEAGPHEVLTCAEQLSFNPISSTPASSS
ncbi:hypothetical protein HS088_TW21G01800 [Tripterygium wilfordii]|uniref:Glycoside hydrolase family 19 catalytic domain-containing protein n=1 Tax=Tripterygium wilfordii TaxID=458696 RepID=A0A7J7C651_TRIWF|nr:hypothetical protein HS088_TW21G01800 [Tripterygium wilfordii]